MTTLIKYVPGTCLEPTCTLPAVENQLFCFKHAVSGPVKSERSYKGQPQPKSAAKSKTKKTKVRLVSDMFENEVGFVQEAAIFEHQSLLKIISNSTVTLNQEDYHTVKVRYKKGYYEIDRNTIEAEDLYLGIPDNANNVTTYRAKFVGSF